jgi:hypothetical protein
LILTGVNRGTRARRFHRGPDEAEKIGFAGPALASKSSSRQLLNRKAPSADFFLNTHFHA